MVKTRQELINRALSNLGALPVGQTASTQEYASVEALVTPTLESLSERDVYYVEDENAIEDKVFIALGRCLAWSCVDEFGVGGEELVKLQNAKVEAESELKQIGSEPPTYKTLEVLSY